jgi:glycosyltransferase involved in cell wall biosynthesis
LMHRAAVAVTVFGVSFFELIALGVPTVVFSPYGEKDSRELQGIAEQRVALVAQDAEDAAEQAAMLLKNSDLRTVLSNNARNKLKNFDGEYFAEEVRLLLAA